MKTTKAQRDELRLVLGEPAMWRLRETWGVVLDDLDEALALLKRARAAIDPHCAADAELMAEIDAALANHPAPENGKEGTK